MSLSPQVRYRTSWFVLIAFFFAALAPSLGMARGESAVSQAVWAQLCSAATEAQDKHFRAWRWLFYFLHSWDTPDLLRSGWMRELLLIFLSVGGAIVATAGIVIGWRRVRTWRAENV